MPNRDKRENAMLAIMLALLVAATSYSMFLYQNASVTRIRGKTNETLAATVQENKGVFLAALDWRYRALEAVAAGISEQGPDGIEAEFARLRPGTAGEDYLSMYLADAGGSSDIGDGVAINISDRLYFQQSLAGGRGLEAVVSRINDAPRFILSVPVLAQGAISHVLYATFDERTFADVLQTGAAYGDSRTLIFSAAGEIIYGGSALLQGNLLWDLERAGEAETQASLRDALAAGDTGIVTYALNGTETYLAYAPLGVNGWVICTSAPAARVNQEISQTVKSGYLIVTAILILAAAFVLLFAYVVRLNSTRLIENRARLNEIDERYRMALENTSVAVWDFDHARRAISIDARSAKLLGMREGVLENVPESLIASGFVHPESADDLRELHAKLAAGEKSLEGVFLLRAENGEGWRYERVRYTNLFDEKGRAYLAIGMGEDVTAEYAEKRRLDELSLAAQSDSMTGLLNHDATFSHIKRYLRTEGATGAHALFMIDIDDFKRVNDTLGHQRGDAAIKEIAAAIRATFRATDIVGRVGGDEFMVLLKNAPDTAFIERKAHELRDALHIPAGFVGDCPPVSASTGVALYQGDGRPFEQIYAEADSALYRAKSEGKDRYRIGAQP